MSTVTYDEQWVICPVCTEEQRPDDKATLDRLYEPVERTFTHVCLHCGVEMQVQRLVRMFYAAKVDGRTDTRGERK